MNFNDNDNHSSLTMLLLAHMVMSVQLAHCTILVIQRMNYHLIHFIKWKDEFLKMKIERVSWEASRKGLLDELNG